MPQAAPQAQQQTMDEAMKQAIAAHEDGQQEPDVETAPEEDAPETEVEAPDGEQAHPEANAQDAATEAPATEEKPATQTPPVPTREAKGGKQNGGDTPASKPIPALSAWPPRLREQFHTLPRAVKDQIIKSHGDFARGLSERDRQIAAAKQQVEAAKPLAEALSPFMSHLQSVGVAPAAAVRNLFQTEYVLRTGGEPQKAAIVANLMSTYGVTPAALVSALEGKPAAEARERPTPKRAPEPPPKDPRVDILLGNLQRQAKVQQAAREQQDEAALHAFLNSGKAEFFDDVAQDMTELAKLPRNKDLSYEQLYEKACLLNDDVRSVLEKRKASEATTLRNQKAQQARRAASSVKTEPGAPQGARKSSLDDEMKRVIEAHYGPQAE